MHPENGNNLITAAVTEAVAMADNARGLWVDSSIRVSALFLAMLGDNSTSGPALEASYAFLRVKQIDSDQIDGINIYCSDDHWEDSPDFPGSVQEVKTQDYLFTAANWRSCGSTRAYDQCIRRR